MIKVKDLLDVIPYNTPIEIGCITVDGPRTVRLSSFREETLAKLGRLDSVVCLVRLDKQKNETVLRIVTED